MRVHRTLLRSLLCGAAAVAVLAPGGAALADPSASQVQSQIDNASNNLENIVEAYNGINENLKTTQAAADALNAKMKPLQDQMDAAYGNVSSIAAAAYKSSSGLSNVAIVLGAGSTDTMVDQLATLRHISQVRQQDLSGYTELKKQYTGEQTRLAQLLANQTAQQQDLASRKAKIESDLQNLQTLMARVKVPARTTSQSTGAGGGGGGPVDNGPPPNVSGAAGKAVAFAFAQLGKPYAWGAAGPGSYDCSGLTMQAWAAAGVSLPHNAAQQWSKMRHIPRSAIQPGDLAFYRGLEHVGIYIGNNTIIHAPHTGTDVQKASVDIMPPYGFGRPG